MNFRETINLIYQKKWLIFWATILGAVLVFDLMVIQEPKYRADSKILVVQKQTAGQDIYTISKSAQYLTKILKEGIYSDSFFEKVINSSEEISKNDFSDDFKERRRQWQKDIKVAIVRDLGVMEISVFYPEKEKAQQISQAIINTLEKEHNFYHGGSQNVEVKILDKPLVSHDPITINLWIGIVLGALLGFLISLALVIKNGIKNKLSLEESFNQEVSSLDRNEFSI